MCEFSRFVEMQIYMAAFDSNNNRITKTNKAKKNGKKEEKSNMLSGI